MKVQNYLWEMRDDRDETSVVLSLSISISVCLYLYLYLYLFPYLYLLSLSPSLSVSYPSLKFLQKDVDNFIRTRKNRQVLYLM